MYHATAMDIRLNRDSAAMRLLQPVHLHRGMVIIRGIQHELQPLIQPHDCRALPVQMTLGYDVNWVLRVKRMQSALVRQPVEAIRLKLLPDQETVRPVKAIRPKPAPAAVVIHMALPTLEDQTCTHEFVALGLTPVLDRVLMGLNPVQIGLGTTLERLFVH